MFQAEVRYDVIEQHVLVSLIFQTRNGRAFSGNLSYMVSLIDGNGIRVIKATSSHVVTIPFNTTRMTELPASEMLKIHFATVDGSSFRLHYDIEITE